MCTSAKVFTAFAHQVGSLFQFIEEETCSSEENEQWEDELG